IDPKNKEHRGRVVKTTGDGILIEFPSVVDAVGCAIQVQQGMLERNADLPPEKRIEFRVGVNLGDVIIDGRDLYSSSRSLPPTAGCVKVFAVLREPRLGSRGDLEVPGGSGLVYANS